MEERTGFINRLEQVWARLSVRERRMAVIWLISVSCMATFVVGFKSWNAITDSGTSVEENIEALELIERKRAEYISSRGDNNKSLKERIKLNELKIATFVDKEASKFELKIDNFKESSAPVGSNSRSSRQDSDKAAKGTIIEESVNVNIRGAEYDKVARFLDAIQRSKELLVIKRVEVNRKRRSRDKSSVDVTLTVSTFKTKREG